MFMATNKRGGRRGKEELFVAHGFFMGKEERRRVGKSVNF